MKNIKKALSVLLAFAMMLSVGISSFAFEDVSDGTKISEAVGILSNLGIIEGFEDGTFRPENSVTRAQMAAIICRTLGYDDQAESSAGSTIFADVPASHWASGYINVAQSLGIINGYGNGNYGPENQVTYEQAVKMIVVALGYELDAQSKGGWPNGYLAVASREGITKNSGGSVGVSAMRGTIAVLVYNSLEVRLMDQKSWSTSGDDEFGKTKETILSQYLDVMKVEGIVETVPFSNYATSGYEDDADNTISFAGGAKAFYYTDNGTLKSDGEVAAAYDISLVPEANELAQKKVIAYVSEEADDETGKHMVYAIAEKQGANKVTKISATQLVTKDESYWEAKDDKGVLEGIIGYKEVGSSRIQTLDLEGKDKGAEIVINYGAVKTPSRVASTKELAEIFKGTGGSIEFISNDANSKVDVILATVYALEGEAVIEDVYREDEMISFDCLSGELDDFDTEDEDSLAVVIKDGKLSSIEAIEEGDTVSVVGGLHDSFRVYYVSSKTVVGSVESYDDDCVEIAGEEYQISPIALDKGEYSSTADLSGKEGIFFLNVDGQIAYDKAEASKGGYAVVLAVSYEGGLGASYMMEAVLSDGTVATYPLSSSAKVYDEYGKATAGVDDKTTAELIAGKSLARSEAVRVTDATIKDAVYQITVKNGKVTKLTEVKKGVAASSEREFDEENMSYGSVYFDEATVVISVSSKKGAAVESGKVEVGAVSDFFVDGEGGATIQAYDENNHNVAGLVIGFNLSQSVAQNGDAFIISSKKTREIDGDKAYVVTGMQAGQTVTYTIYDEEPEYNAADLKIGNVILLGAANSSGVVSDFELLYDIDSGKLGTGIADEDEEYYFAGQLNEGDKDENKEPTNNKFYYDGKPISQFSSVSESKKYGYVDGDGISLRTSANYTLVDYSENQRNPEITKKSKSKSIFGTLSKYDSIVFVRYYDGDLREVIVYRFKNSKIDVPTTETPEPPKVVAKPEASPAGGEVAKDSTVTLTGEEGAKIYYTKNGEAPTEASEVYSAPIAITENVTIKAIAVLDGTKSDVASFEYTIAASMMMTPPVKEEEKTEATEKKEEEKAPSTELKLNNALKAELKADLENPKPALSNKLELKKPEESLKITEIQKTSEKKLEDALNAAISETKKEEPEVKTTELKKDETILKAAIPDVKKEEPAVKSEAPQIKEEAPAAKLEEKQEAAGVKAPAKLDDVAKTIAKADIKKAALKKIDIKKLDIKKLDKAALVKDAAKISKAPEKLVVSVKINLNTATAEELAKIDGISEALASQIVSYRTKNGVFKAVDGLKSVPGVTEVLYNAIKDNFTI